MVAIKARKLRRIEGLLVPADGSVHTGVSTDKSVATKVTSQISRRVRGRAKVCVRSGLGGFGRSEALFNAES